MLDSNLRTTRMALDRHLEPARRFANETLANGFKGNYVTFMRRALGMTHEQLGVRLGISRQAAQQMEVREQAGVVTIESLRAAAEALGCDLVYALVPRDSLESRVQTRAKEVATQRLKDVHRTMQLEDQATAISERDVADYVARHITERDLWSDS